MRELAKIPFESETKPMPGSRETVIRYTPLGTFPAGLPVTVPVYSAKG